MNLRDDLKAYLDGELAPERMAEMREAIDRDPALAKEAEALGGISMTLRAAAAQPASAGLEATLRALERAERRERKAWWPWLLPVAGMTAFLAFAVVPTMQQAKMAAKSDASVAFHKEVQLEPTMSAPAMEMAKEGDGTSNGVSSSKVASDSPVAERRNQISSLKPDAVKSIREKRLDDGYRSTIRSEAEKSGKAPRKVSPLPSVTNARAGDMKGQTVPPSGDFSNTKNIVVEPKELKDGKEEAASTLEVRIALAKVPVETIVIEVESQAEANDVARELVARMGAEDEAGVARRVEQRDSVPSSFDAASNRTQVKTERRVILEVDEDDLAETKKRVSETVKESQLRRESQQSRLRGGAGAPGGPGGGGGFAGGGVNQSQQGETSQGTRQQGPPDTQQLRGGQQSGSGQSAVQGFQSKPTTPKTNAASSPEGKKGTDLQRSKQNAPKPRKRIEIIFRIKPKPAGKLEE